MIYQWVSYRVYDHFINNTTNTNFYHRPGDSKIYYENLQPSSLVYSFPNVVDYSQNSNKFLFNYNSLWWKFYKFSPWDNERLIQAYPLTLTNANKSANTDNFWVKITYDIWYYPAIKWTAPNVSWNSNSHKECIFYKVWFCWDSKVTNWEVCDPNDPSKNGWWNWGCNDVCKTNK